MLAWQCHYKEYLANNNNNNISWRSTQHIIESARCQLLETKQRWKMWLTKVLRHNTQMLCSRLSTIGDRAFPFAVALSAMNYHASSRHRPYDFLRHLKTRFFQSFLSWLRVFSVKQDFCHYRALQSFFVTCRLTYLDHVNLQLKLVAFLKCKVVVVVVLRCWTEKLPCPLIWTYTSCSPYIMKQRKTYVPILRLRCIVYHCFRPLVNNCCKELIFNIDNLEHFVVTYWNLYVLVEATENGSYFCLHIRSVDKISTNPKTDN